MTLAHQSEAPGPATRRASPILTAATLLLLIGACGLSLDRSELSPAEGVHAQAALGPLENDSRCVPRLSAWDPLYRLWRGWALVVGTTERPLRLLVVLGLFLAALVTAEVGARLFGSGARPLVYLVWISSPWLARHDVLHPGLLSPLPVALLLGGLVFGRRGSPWWLLATLLGAAALPALDPRLFLPGVLWLLLPLAAGRSRAAWTSVLPALGVAFLAGLVLHPDAALGLPRPPPVPAGAPGWLAAAFTEHSLATPLLLGLVVALPFLARSDSRLLVLWPLGSLVATVLLFLVPGAAGDGHFAGAGWSGLLPVAALLVAAAATRPFPWGRTSSLLLLVLAALPNLAPLVHTSLLEARRSEDPVAARPEDNPMRALLARARAVAASGGRLVVAGPLRQGILFYSRRGHDPGVPLLCLPEEVQPDELAAVLREQLGVRPGEEERQPPILMHPRPAVPPPGLELVEETPWADQALSLLRLSRAGPR